MRRAEGLLERDVDDLGAAQGDHAAPAPLDHRVARRHAEPRGEHPVVRRGRAAALDVPQGRGAGLDAGALLDEGGEALADAAEPRAAEGVETALGVRVVSWSGTKPSATTTSGARPRSYADCTHSTIWSMLVACSGIRIACAPAAMPECRAIQPTWRPMTSATMQRLCDSPVVRRRSMASVAIWTAVSKPNV